MRLLLIDSHVISKSPTMKGWIRSLPIFRDMFDEIEIWSLECEIAHTSGIKWRKVETVSRLSTVQTMVFRREVRKRLAELDTSDTLVQVTGCLIHKADIRYIQFWNRALLEERRKRPDSLKLSFFQRFVSFLTALDEQKVVRTAGSTGAWWVVSRNLADRINKDGNGGGVFEIIPNQYDPARFNHEVSATNRQLMRAHHGLPADSLVFAFSAFGHFERKGLLQAVQALSLVCQRIGNVKFLILGGKETTISRFRRMAADRQIDLDFCVFAGLVADMEKHLSAADALLFPSHFEAFSLAEIEAAALGLRLYLTRHYGSEMILREPVNGRWLPWDPEGMATVIVDDIHQGNFGKPHHELGEALNPEQFGLRLRELYSKALSKKQRAKI